MQKKLLFTYAVISSIHISIIISYYTMGLTWSRNKIMKGGS